MKLLKDVLITKKFILMFLVIAVLTAPGVIAQTGEVNADITYQEIEGFGGANVW